MPLQKVQKKQKTTLTCPGHLLLFTPVKFSTLIASDPFFCVAFSFPSRPACVRPSAALAHPGPTAPPLPFLPGRCLAALTAPGLRARRHFWLLCWWYAALRPLGEILVRGRVAPDPLSAKISRFVEAGGGGGGRVGCRAGRSGCRRSIATQLRGFRH